MSGMEPQELELEGVSVTSTPLPYERAEDSLPEVAQLVTLVMERGAAVLESIPEGELKSIADLKHLDVMTLAKLLGPVLASVADKLGNGTLKRLAPLLMYTTQVVMADTTGQKAKYDLMKPADRAAVFNAHPETYFPILFHAGKVTYARYFPAAVLGMSATRTAS